MARRTRRFESLEERRLLAAVSTSPDVAALVAAPTTAAGTSAPAAGTAGASNGATPDSAPDATPGDANSGGYGPTATAAASSSAGEYGSYTDYAASAAADHYTSASSTEYYPRATSTPAATTSTSTDSGSLSAQAAAVQVLQSAQANATSNNAPSSTLVSGAAAGAPAAGSPGGPVRFDPQDLVARRELAEPSSGAAAIAVVAGDDAHLVAPVAWGMWGEQHLPVASEPEADAPSAVRERPVLSEPPRSAALIAGAVGVELAFLERGVDDLLERLEQLGDELPSASTALHVGECVVLTAGAAAAFEYVRAQFREGGSWQGFIDGGREPWEPRLRRRWFRRPAESRSHR